MMKKFEHGAATLLVVFAVTLGALALPVSASTFVALETEELVSKSSAIVQGRVVETQSFWNENGTVIVTEALVQIEDALAGEVGSFVKIRTFGGEVDGYIVEAHGFPKFHVEDRILVFLREGAHEHEANRVTGYQQGHYQIVEREGVELAIPTVDEGATLVTLSGGSIPTPTALPLAELKTQIRTIHDELEAVQK